MDASGANRSVDKPYLAKLMTNFMDCEKQVSRQKKVHTETREAGFTSSLLLPCTLFMSDVK